MADIPRMVDEIRGFLLAYDQSLKPHLSPLARDYASACVEVNQRLAKCQRLLQQGLRVEALHTAKESPDLLDTIQALDFADRMLWVETVKQYDLAIPPEFDATAIEFLQSAFVEEDPLKDLLRSHRRLALTRSPLPLRLDLLRKLAGLDPNNAIWPVDIQALEVARIEQIKDEAAEAKRRQDVAAMGLLNDELSSKSWLTPPPKPLVRGVAQTLSQYREFQNRQDKMVLVSSINEAFAALDVDQARELRRRWYQLNGNPRGVANDPFADQVEPAMLWLEEMDRQEQEEHDYHQAVDDLSEALNQEAPRVELEQLRDDLLRFGKGLPKDLDARHQARIDQLSRSFRRKVILIGVSVGVVVLMLCVLALAIAWQLSQGVAARDAADRINKEVASERLDKARTFVDDFSKSSPGLAEHPAVAAALVRLGSAEGVEAGRVARFEAAFRDAVNSPIAADEPSTLEFVRTLARSTAEKARVVALGDRRRREYRDQLARIDGEARPKLEALGRRFDLLEKSFDSPGNLDSARGLLREVTGELREISAPAGRAGVAVQDQLKELVKRSDRVRDEIHRRDLRRDAELQVTRSSMPGPSTADDFARSLANAIEAQPDLPRSADFRRVIGERTSWEAALAWAEVGHDWRLAPRVAIRPSEALGRAARCSKILADFPKGPDRPLVDEAHPHYLAIASRTSGAENLRDQVALVLDDYFTSNVFRTTIRETEGEVFYYSKRPIDPTGAAARLFYLDGVSKEPQHLSINKARVGATVEAPQSLLAAILKTDLKRDSSVEDWDSLMVRMLRLIAEDRETDPILKVAMIGRIAKIAGEGSLSLKSNLGATCRAIDEAQMPLKLAWMDPKDGPSKAARAKARRVIEALPPWANIQRDAIKAEQEFAGRLAAIPRPVGWLLKDRGWACRTSPGVTLPTSGELLVVVPSKPWAQWKTVGRLQGGSVVFENHDRDRLVEGRLLFLRDGPGKS